MKWIIFDAYGTLFDAGKYNIKRIAEEIASKYSVDTQEVYKAWTSKYIEMENDSKRSFQTIARTNRESLAYVFDRFKMGNEYEYYVNRMKEEWSIPMLMPGAYELLNWLKSQACRLGIISNSDNDTLMSAIKYNAIPIDNVISSEMAKSYKPAVQIFEYALGNWGCTPEQCIYIGNSCNDVKASIAAGIKCIYLHTEENRVDFKIEGSDCYPVKGLLECKEYIKLFLQDKV